MASAAAASAADTACAPDPGDGLATVQSVSEALDIDLADGRRLRLAGLDPPLATPASPDLPGAARRALTAWLSGGSPATLRLLSETPDRWGRLPALLFREDGASAAGVLVRAGLGRARPDPLAHGCFAGLLGAEDAARLDRLGLWADPGYAVHDAGETDALAGQAGGLALVEGILHVHEARGALYLTLGRDRWGFTAVLSRRDTARFIKAGLDPRDYEGTPVRLRGDLDARFGLRLRLTDPDQVESLEPGSLADPARPPAPVTRWDGAATMPRSTGR